MTTSRQPLNQYGVIAHIFELINELSETQKIDLLKQLAKDNITTQLYKLIIDIPENEHSVILAQLQEMLQKKGDRKYPRKPCLITVDYAVGGRAFKNYIQDISTSGVFIETGESLPVGKEIVLTFSFSDTHEPFKIAGKISRRTTQGIGVKFSSLTQLQENIIKTLVDRMKEV